MCTICPIYKEMKLYERKMLFVFIQDALIIKIYINCFNIRLLSLNNIFENMSKKCKYNLNFELSKLHTIHHSTVYINHPKIKKKKEINEKKN